MNAGTGAEEAGPDVGFYLILFQPRKRGCPQRGARVGGLPFYGIAVRRNGVPAARRGEMGRRVAGRPWRRSVWGRAQRRGLGGMGVNGRRPEGAGAEAIADEPGGGISFSGDGWRGGPLCGVGAPRGWSCTQDDVMRPRRPPAGACDEDGLAARWEEPATTERIRSLRYRSGVGSRGRDRW